MAKLPVNLPEILAIADYEKGVYHLCIQSTSFRHPLRRTSRAFEALPEGMIHYHDGEVEMFDARRIPNMNRLRVVASQEFTHDQLRILEGIAKMHNDYVDAECGRRNAVEMIRQRAP